MDVVERRNLHRLGAFPDLTKLGRPFPRIKSCRLHDMPGSLSLSQINFPRRFLCRLNARQIALQDITSQYVPSRSFGSKLRTHRHHTAFCHMRSIFFSPPIFDHDDAHPMASLSQSNISVYNIRPWSQVMARHFHFLNYVEPSATYCIIYSVYRSKCLNALHPLSGFLQGLVIGLHAWRWIATFAIGDTSIPSEELQIQSDLACSSRDIVSGMHTTKSIVFVQLDRAL